LKSTKESDTIHKLKTEIRSLRELNFTLKREQEFKFIKENIYHGNRSDMLPPIMTMNSYKRYLENFLIKRNKEVKEKRLKEVLGLREEKEVLVCCN
jgi:hypothetical protein